MTSFKDLQTSTKVLVLSLSLTGLLLIMSGYGVYLLISNQRIVARMESEIVRQIGVVQSFQSEAQQLLSGLFNLVLMATNESDDGKLSGAVKEYNLLIDKLRASEDQIVLSLNQANYPSEEVFILQKKNADFLKSAAGIVEMAESDPVTAQVWMTSAKRRFSEYSTTLDEANNFLVKKKEEVLKDLFSSMERGRLVFVLTTVVIAGFGFVLSLIIGSKISRPIKDMAQVILSLANKNYSVSVPALGQRDEIGNMATAVEGFKTSLANADRLAAEQDADRRRREERAKKLDALTVEFERQVGDLVNILSSASTELETTAGVMSDNANQAAQQATDVAHKSERTSANVQTVASAAEELAASVQEISRQVQGSTQVTSRAIEDVRRTDGVVNDLATGAEKIGEVIVLIDSIANQTNLLALNATIEAARAGDAGKGFAVVASEVKNLANQTSGATQEISAQITQMQNATREAVKAIRAIGDTIHEVDGIQQSIASSVEEQGAATKEITRNVQEASEGTSQVAINIMKVKEAATNTGQATGEVLTSATEVSKQSEHLRTSVQKFIAGVKGA